MATVKLRDNEIEYDMYGSGIPMVLLHGFPYNRSMWQDQIDPLKEKYRVIVPDLRGLGASSVCPSASMDEMAQDVAALLDHLELQRVMMIGFSLGGYVAFAFSRRYALRIRGLILANTRPLADSEEAQATREQQALAVLKSGMAPLADILIPQLLAAATINDNKAVVDRVREMILSTDPAGAAAALRGMAERSDSVRMLQRIIAPTLVIAGESDAIVPMKESELMHSEIRGSRLVVIPGVGHSANLENPAEFNRALTGFLRAL